MQARCFFLDANIVISEILNENNPRILKFIEDSKVHKIPCYISDSVKNEVAGKVDRTTNYLGNIIRQTVKAALDDNRTRRRVPLDAPMDFQDVSALEELYSVSHGTARSRGSCLVGPLTEVEQWSIKFIADKLNKGDKFTIDEFVLELTKILLATTSVIDDIYDNLVEFEKGHIKTKYIPIDPSVRHLAHIAEGYDIHYPDSIHVACAFTYQITKNEKVVFTTQDYGIINHKQDLWHHRIKVEISHPLYAIYHF
jgi:predicted nucleic acid-binding protein